MGNDICEYTRTGEKYKCPISLNAFAGLFPSLQCDMRACLGDKKNLEDNCKSCDHYIVNAQERDWEKIDGPI